MEYDVIIVGAGMCGLFAARELSNAGKSVLILEARERIGGRVYPLSTAEFGYEAQGGAEFVHGSAPVTSALIAEAGLTLSHPTMWWSVLDGEPTRTTPISAHEPLLEEKLNAITEDMTVGEFLVRNFSGEDSREIREYVQRRVEGYDAADIDRASVIAFRDEMTFPETWEQRNLKEGYGALLRFLESKCHEQNVEILLNKHVLTVDHREDTVSTVCADGSKYEARKVLITVPTPLLSQLQFVPPLPEKMEAATHIGFGPVLKVLIRFKSKWWTGVRERVFEQLFFMFSTEEIPTWWTQYPEPHTTLTGWVAGPKVRAFRNKTHEEILSIALTSLSNIFHISLADLRRELVCMKAFDWETEKFSGGAYSYTMPETPAAIEVLREPVESKLFFAGEALARGSTTATVEGALSSGKSTAEQILANS